MIRSVLLSMSRSAALERFATQRAFARRAVRRFMPGEALDDAVAAAATLGRSGIGAVFTQLGENVRTPGEAAGTASHYEQVLARAAELDIPGQVSVKPTHLGLDLGEDVALRNLERLVRRAGEMGSTIWVDMEDSSYVDRTLDLVTAVGQESPGVGVCLQAYLHRTPADLDRLRRAAIRVRLVKGAYRERPDVAIPRKKEVDRRFHDLAARMIEDRDYIEAAAPVFGTHDAGLIGRLRQSARARGLRPGQIEFHMLYGIRADLQQRLAGEGEVVRVLISYGERWYPWYVRRLAERPANLWFVARQVVRR